MPNYVGKYSQKYIHQHLPNLFHDARERGDRVVDPFEWFQQHFQYKGDAKFVNAALEWIFSRIEMYAYDPQYVGNTFDDPDPMNYFYKILSDIQIANSTGNTSIIYQEVRKAVKLFDFVAMVLRSDLGLNFSYRLLDDYCEAAKRLLPWTSFYDSSSTFKLVRSAYELSGQNKRVLQVLGQAMGPAEMNDARTDAWEAWTTKGDFLALDIAR